MRSLVRVQDGPPDGGLAQLVERLLCKQDVRQVTSGTLSPTLNYPIALAYVSAELANIKQQLEVDIRGKTYPAQVVKRPFYKSQNRTHK